MKSALATFEIKNWDEQPEVRTHLRTGIDKGS